MSEACTVKPHLPGRGHHSDTHEGVCAGYEAQEGPGLRGQGCWTPPGARDPPTQCGRKATYVPTGKLCFQSEHRAKNPQMLKDISLSN